MRKPIIFVLLAGFAALVAVLVVYSALNRIEPPVPFPYAQSIGIVVAAHDLAIGSKLDQNSIKLTRWWKNSVPPGAFTDPESVMGLYTKTDFVENEPIVVGRLTKSPNSAKIPSPVN